jgi:hypothetical protein
MCHLPRPTLHSKKIVFLPNLYPGEEHLEFRTDLLNLKRFHSKSTECFLSSADPYETPNVLPLDTGSVKKPIFLECNSHRYMFEIIMD